MVDLHPLVLPRRRPRRLGRSCGRLVSRAGPLRPPFWAFGAALVTLVSGAA